MASTFWKAAIFPKWGDFEFTSGLRTWLFHKTFRKLRMTPFWAWLVVLSFVRTILVIQSTP